MLERTKVWGQGNLVLAYGEYVSRASNGFRHVVAYVSGQGTIDKEGPEPDEIAPIAGTDVIEETHVRPFLLRIAKPGEAGLHLVT